MRSLWYGEGEEEDGMGKRWWYGEGRRWYGKGRRKMVWGGGGGMVRGGGDGMGRRRWYGEEELLSPSTYG